MRSSQGKKQTTWSDYTDNVIFVAETIYSNIRVEKARRQANYKSGCYLQINEVDLYFLYNKEKTFLIILQ